MTAPCSRATHLPTLCCLLQELETLLWAVCRLEHRADDLVAEMAAEVSRAFFSRGCRVFSFVFVLVTREGSMGLIECQMRFDGLTMAFLGYRAFFQPLQVAR